MKKLMFALIAAACCSLMAASAEKVVLVYDYAASFKRLDVTTPVKVKFGGSVYKMDTAKVASDKFNGYVVIDACKACSGAMEYSAETGEADPGNYAVVYIKRNGNNKLTKNLTYRAIGRFYAAKFGAKSGEGHINASTAVHVNESKYTDGLGFLSYWIDAPGNAAAGKPGFLGVDHSSNLSDVANNWWEKPTAHDPLLVMDYDTVDNAGYGKLVALTQVVSVDCFADITKTCYAIKNLSGSILGGFGYMGLCNAPIYDLCALTADNLPVKAQLAPIAGTFTMKLNNSISFYKKAFALNSFTAAENVIKGKMGFSKPYGNVKETKTFNSDKSESLVEPLVW
ncbi:MAG: hypothetical protein J5654_03655 [Victivallales bacterium]|nr:hypothetical protein [Victivallales bacterium]